MGEAKRVFGLELGVQMRHQPSQAGRPSATTAYFQKIHASRIGMAQRRHVHNPLAGYQVLSRQRIETTVQWSATCAPSPELITTPGDVLQIVAQVLQSDAGIRAMIDAGMAPLRIRDITIVQVRNDRNEWEEQPVFDAVLVHSDFFTDGVPVAHIDAVRMWPV